MQKFKALIIVIMAAISFPLWADQKIAVININAALEIFPFSIFKIFSRFVNKSFIGTLCKSNL